MAQRWTRRKLQRATSHYGAAHVAAAMRNAPPPHTHYCPSANHCMSCGDDRNAGVRDNDTLCLVRYEPMPAKEVQQPLLERTTSSQAMRRFRSSDDDMALTLG